MVEPYFSREARMASIWAAASCCKAVVMEQIGHSQIGLTRPIRSLTLSRYYLGLLTLALTGQAALLVASLASNAGPAR